MARRSSDHDDDDARRSAALARIRQFPDPVLRQPARPVEAFDDELRTLVDRMLGLMHDAHGAGLAAPQIGLLQRVFVYQLEDDPVVLVNPVIVEASDERAVGGEGCLSLALLIEEGHDVAVERHERVTVRARDADGNEVERVAAGHEARVIQHELDHLDGVLIIDRTSREERAAALQLLRAAFT